jgi:hypothetical protein
LASKRVKKYQFRISFPYHTLRLVILEFDMRFLISCKIQLTGNFLSLSQNDTPRSTLRFCTSIAVEYLDFSLSAPDICNANIPCSICNAAESSSLRHTYTKGDTRIPFRQTQTFRMWIQYTAYNVVISSQYTLRLWRF